MKLSENAYIRNLLKFFLGVFFTISIFVILNENTLIENTPQLAKYGEKVSLLLISILISSFLLAVVSFFGGLVNFVKMVQARNIYFDNAKPFKLAIFKNVSLDENGRIARDKLFIFVTCFLFFWMLFFLMTWQIAK